MPRQAVVGETVSHGNFAKKLSKELGRNKKKTAVLALISVIAIWFWVPLVWKWVAPEGAVDHSVAPTVEANSNQIQQPAESGAKPSPVVELNWQNLKELFESHQLMSTAELRAELASPFCADEPDQESTPSFEPEQIEEEPVEDEVVSALTPAQLGLSLSSTITGSNIRLAIINGKTARIGTTIVIPDGVTPVELTLVDILPNSVVLSSGSGLHELRRATASTSMELSMAGQFAAADGSSPDGRIIIDTPGRD